MNTATYFLQPCPPDKAWIHHHFLGGPRRLQMAPPPGLASLCRPTAKEATEAYIESLREAIAQEHRDLAEQIDQSNARVAELERQIGLTKKHLEAE